MEYIMEKLLTPLEVAEITGLSIGALAQMRYTGTGPAYRRLSPKSIRYVPTDIEEFIAGARRTQTGQAVAV